jgi:hypothetical protein
MPTRYFTAAALAGLLIAAPGCGTKTVPPPPQPFPVHGKVLLPGNQPLRGGVVTFRPVGDPEDRRYQGWGFPKPDGSFEVAATGNAIGLAPGRYKVTVGPRDEGEPRGSNVNLIPKKYQSENTTPLEVEIKPEENNLRPFVLQ